MSPELLVKDANAQLLHSLIVKDGLFSVGREPGCAIVLPVGRVVGSSRNKANASAVTVASDHAGTTACIPLDQGDRANPPYEFWNWVSGRHELNDPVWKAR